MWYFILPVDGLAGSVSNFSHRITPNRRRVSRTGSNYEHTPQTSALNEPTVNGSYLRHGVDFSFPVTILFDKESLHFFTGLWVKAVFIMKSVLLKSARSEQCGFASEDWRTVDFGPFLKFAQDQTIIFKTKRFCNRRLTRFTFRSRGNTSYEFVELKGRFCLDSIHQEVAWNKKSFADLSWFGWFELM